MQANLSNIKPGSKLLERPTGETAVVVEVGTVGARVRFDDTGNTYTLDARGLAYMDVVA